MKLVCLAFGVLVISLIIGCGGGGGTGGSGTGGDGGDLGRIYIAEGGIHDRIVRMDNIHGDNWIPLGSTGDGINQFNSPRCVAFDSQGRIYIADCGNNRIVRMNDFTGAGWTVYGEDGNGLGEFNQPNKIFIDSNDRIYISDTENDRIVRVDDMNGTNWIAYGTSGSGPGQFDAPYGLWATATHIYVCDFFNDRIIRMDNMSGANWTEFNDPRLDGPGDIRIYGNKMLVSARNYGVIRTDLMSDTGWQEIRMSNPQSSCIGTSGKVYVVDQNDDLAWQFPSIAGGNPVKYGNLGQNEFTSPTHIAFGP